MLGGLNEKFDLALKGPWASINVQRYNGIPQALLRDVPCALLLYWVPDICPISDIQFDT